MLDPLGIVDIIQIDLMNRRTVLFSWYGFVTLRVLSSECRYFLCQRYHYQAAYNTADSDESPDIQAYVPNDPVYGQSPKNLRINHDCGCRSSVTRDASCEEELLYTVQVSVMQ